MRVVEKAAKVAVMSKRYLVWYLFFFVIVGLRSRVLFAQDISTTSNALDRINFGDIGTDPYSESAHAFVNLSQPTGTGALGLTYRKIAPSSTPSDVGIEADNEMLTFTMACNPTLQNYLTIQVWGSDTILDFIYLYNATQGYVSNNYYGTNNPEIDFQTTTDPILPGRFVYETVPIPLSMTSGNTSVTLTLNAVQTSGGQLGSGQTSRPIYSAFTHTNPYLIVASTDPQGTAPSASAPTPTTYNSAYFSSIVSSISSYVTAAASNQYYGSSWTAAVTAGTVPAQVVGAFGCCGVTASTNNTITQWLNNTATYTGGDNSGNNVVMQRLEMLAYAYVTPNFLTSFYQNSTTEQQVVAALDSYSYMQALNGCWGDLAGWDGLVTNSASFTSQGRKNAQCSPIEGQGTWAIGAAIFQMQGDPSFRTALNQDINNTLEPGVLRYQAYQTMLVNNINFLTSAVGHGHAPNQDLLQARSYVYSNLALRALDTIYGTSLAQSNATMYSNYLNETSGLVQNSIPDLWISNGGLGLEVNGSLNGSFDGGGYGWNDAYYLTALAKILNDNGIETSSSHPVRNVAINATHAFSNFLYPSLVTSGSGYATTVRNENYLTARHDGDVGPIDPLSLYYSAVDFSDPYAIHGFYLEHANGIIQPMFNIGTWTAMPVFNSGQADNSVVDSMLAYPDYVTLCNMVNSNPTDTTGVTFLNETAHGNGVWADPTGNTIAIQNNGEAIRMAINWRLTETYGVSTPISTSEPMDNVARIHDTTATMDREATVKMPSSAATGASGNYTSGTAETLYIARYGNYLVGLNYQNSAATLTLPPDMETTGGTATNLVTGTNYNLSNTTSVPVPAGGAVALYQYLPTATLSTTSISFGSHTVYTQTPSAVMLSNTGSGPLMIVGMGISGGQASDFSYTTTCGSTLAMNANCTITLTYDPNASGVETSTFSLTTSLSTTPQTISLNGTGIGYNSSTVLGTSAAMIAYGTSVTLTATVSSPNGTPNGTVSFYSGSTLLGTGTLNGSGVATLGTTALAVGTDSVTAKYTASADYVASTSSPVTETVLPAGMTVGSALTFTPSIINTIGGNGTSGDSGDGGSATSAELSSGTNAVAADAAGDIFFVDGGNYTVRVIYEGGATASALIKAENPSVTMPVVGDIYLIAGIEGSSGTPAVGLASSQKFKPGATMGIDLTGDLYVSDGSTNKVWEIYSGGLLGKNYTSMEAGVSSPTLGYMYAVAGGGAGGFAGDGDLATNSAVGFHGLNNIAFDSSGNMYIVDQGNERIREVSVSTGIINTIIGNGTQGSTGDGGPSASAELNTPYGVAIDPYNDVFIVDHGNPDIRVIYEGGSMAAALIQLENPGTTPVVGDVYGITNFSSPTGIALDAAGNVYVAANGRCQVSEVDALTGIVSTVAGNATCGYAGDGGAAPSAKLNGLRDVVVDPAGRIYIPDAANLRVREVGPKGILIFATAQNVGTTSAASTITLNNTGNVTLTFSGTPAFSGTNAGDFTLDTGSSLNTCNLSSLAVGASCNLAITFTPSATGTRTATLTISTNGLLSNQTVSLSGTGQN